MAIHNCWKTDKNQYITYKKIGKDPIALKTLDNVILLNEYLYAQDNRHFNTILHSLLKILLTMVVSPTITISWAIISAPNKVDLGAFLLIKEKLRSLNNSENLYWFGYLRDTSFLTYTPTTRGDGECLYHIKHIYTPQG